MSKITAEALAYRLHRYWHRLWRMEQKPEAEQAIALVRALEEVRQAADIYLRNQPIADATIVSEARRRLQQAIAAVDRIEKGEGE